MHLLPPTVVALVSFSSSRRAAFRFTSTRAWRLIVVAKRMIRPPVTEAIVVAKGMIRTSATEAVVSSLRAKPMIRTPVAQTRQSNELKAKPMLWMPATELTRADGLQQGLGAAPTTCLEQRPNGDRRGRRRGGQCARRSCGECECADDDAVQQRATYRSKSSHGSSLG
jgi:hypothetical protein